MDRILIPCIIYTVHRMKQLMGMMLMQQMQTGGGSGSGVGGSRTTPTFPTNTNINNNNNNLSIDKGRILSLENKCKNKDNEIFQLKQQLKDSKYVNYMCILFAFCILYTKYIQEHSNKIKSLNKIIASKDTKYVQLEVYIYNVYIYMI